MAYIGAIFCQGFFVERFFPNLFKTNYENEMKEKEEVTKKSDHEFHFAQEFVYDETSFSFCTAYSRREKGPLRQVNNCQKNV